MSLLRRATALSVALACGALVLLIAPLPAVALEPDVYVCDDPAMIPTLLVDQTWAQDRTLIGPEMDFARIHVEAGTSYAFSVLSKPGYENARRPDDAPAGPVRVGTVVHQPSAGHDIAGRCRDRHLLHGHRDRQRRPPSRAGPGRVRRRVRVLARGVHGGAAVVGGPLRASRDGPERERHVHLSRRPLPSDGRYPLRTTSIRSTSSSRTRATTSFPPASPGSGLPPDTQLEVWDLGGPARAVNDDGPDGGPLSEVRITATQPGVWRARVNSMKGNRFGAYTLAVSEAQAGTGRVRGQVVGPTGDPVAGRASLAVVPGVDADRVHDIRRERALRPPGRALRRAVSDRRARGRLRPGLRAESRGAR